MDELLLSKASENKLRSFAAHPSHAVLLTGNEWLNKNGAGLYLAAALLGFSIDKLSQYPHFHHIKSQDSKKIGIEDIRKINTYLSLVVPSDKSVSRIIFIEDAQLMTPQSQNALLKNIEEPPLGTVFILSAPSISSLLPTITSRLSFIDLKAKSREELKLWFMGRGHNQKSVDAALNMSGGQPGLMELILASDDHPMSKATKLAKDMLQFNRLERLSLINDLSRDKENLYHFFYILKEMSKIGVRSTNQRSARSWKKILAATLKAESMIKSNAQVKLTLTDFVLNIS